MARTEARQSRRGRDRTHRSPQPDFGRASPRHLTTGRVGVDSIGRCAVLALQVAPLLRAANQICVGPSTAAAPLLGWAPNDGALGQAAAGLTRRHQTKVFSWPPTLLCRVDARQSPRSVAPPSHINAQHHSHTRSLRCCRHRAGPFRQLARNRKGVINQTFSKQRSDTNAGPEFPNRYARAPRGSSDRQSAIRSRPTQDRSGHTPSRTRRTGLSAPYEDPPTTVVDPQPTLNVTPPPYAPRSHRFTSCLSEPFAPLRRSPPTQPQLAPSSREPLIHARAMS